MPSVPRAVPRGIIARLRANPWVVPTMVAAILAAHRIGEPSLWLDEGVSLVVTRRTGAAYWRAVVLDDPAMLLYHVVLRAWVTLGDSEAVARGLSAVCIVATVPLLWWIGARLVDRRTALLGVSLFATNGFVLRYAQEARAYGVLVFLTTVAAACLVRGLDRAPRRWWTAWGVVAGLAVLSHVIGVMTACAHALVLVHVAWRTGRLRALWPGLGAFGVLAGVMVAVMLAADGALARWVPPPTLAAARYVYGEILGTGGDAFLWLGVGCILIALARAGRFRDAAARGIAWLAAWAIVPVALILLVSPHRSLFFDRYLLATVPPLLLLVAAGATRCGPRWLGAVVGAACLVGSVLGYARFPRVPVEDWRGAVAHMVAQAEPQDAVVARVGLGRMVSEYYLRRLGASSPAFVTFGEPLESIVCPSIVPTAAMIDELAERHPRVWLLLSHLDVGGRSRGQYDALEALLRTRYEHRTVRDFPGVSVVRWDRRG